MKSMDHLQYHIEIKRTRETIRASD
jgi:hypothetical protein